MQDKIEGRAANSAAIQMRALEQMTSIGITPLLIDQFVEAFYVRVQKHETLGPVFNTHIQDRWPEHLSRMKLFWNALAFKTGSYGGRPVQAHLGVHGIEPELFLQWLQLFRLTLEDLNVTKHAQDWFNSTAERIARSLTLSLFYNPALDDPQRSKS
jgi:hemoglobin